jgi:hypothetical protein
LMHSGVRVRVRTSPKQVWRPVRAAPARHFRCSRTHELNFRDDQKRIVSLVGRGFVSCEFMRAHVSGVVLNLAPFF